MFVAGLFDFIVTIKSHNKIVIKSRVKTLKKIDVFDIIDFFTFAPKYSTKICPPVEFLQLPLTNSSAGHNLWQLAKSLKHSGETFI